MWEDFKAGAKVKAKEMWGAVVAYHEEALANAASCMNSPECLAMSVGPMPMGTVVARSGGAVVTGRASPVAAQELPLYLDRGFKVHGAIPTHIPSNWSREYLQELADDLRISIANRKASLFNHPKGHDVRHANRIREEERLLGQIEKILSGT